MKTIWSRIFILSVVLSASFMIAELTAQACTCGKFDPDFTSTIRSDALFAVNRAGSEGFKSPTVVLARVLKQVGHGIDVEVERVFSGQIDRKTIRVWGDPGHLCRPYVAGLEEDSRWIFNLQLIEESHTWRDQLEAAGDYALPGCGVYKLAVEPGAGRLEVRGAITRARTSSGDKEVLSIEAFSGHLTRYIEQDLPIYLSKRTDLLGKVRMNCSISSWGYRVAYEEVRLEDVLDETVSLSTESNRIYLDDDEKPESKALESEKTRFKVVLEAYQKRSLEDRQIVLNLSLIDKLTGTEVASRSGTSFDEDHPFDVKTIYSHAVVSTKVVSLGKLKEVVASASCSQGPAR